MVAVRPKAGEPEGVAPGGLAGGRGEGLGWNTHDWREGERKREVGGDRGG